MYPPLVSFVSSSPPPPPYPPLSYWATFFPQLLVKDFTLDSMVISPRQTTFAPGVDYMTDYDEWLHIQVGTNTAAKCTRVLSIFYLCIGVYLATKFRF